MNTIKSLAAVTMAIFMLGCPVRSLNPLFTEKEAEFNPALVGTWLEEKDQATYTFRKSGQNTYAMTWRADGDSASYRVRTGRIGSFWFLDSSPINGANDHHFISAYLITRVQLQGDTLRMSSLKSDRLRDMIDVGNLSIAHVRRDGEIILTATSEELRALVLRLAEDEKAFPDPGILVRAN